MERPRLVKPGASVALAVALVSGCVDVVDEVWLHRTVEALAVGTPEAEVLRRLGRPSDSGNRFHLAQEQGYESEYRAAAASASVHYLFWRGGIDVVCAVGFDRNRRVAYKACGGT